MNIIDDFYRKREIINLIQAWQLQPLTVNLNVNKNIIEVGFRSGLEERLTKEEKYTLLFMIQEELVRTCKGEGELILNFIEKLHAKLKEIKGQVRKDFDLKEVK